MTDRSCLCGCSRSMEHKRRHAKFATDACRRTYHARKTAETVSGERDGLFLLACSMAIALGALLALATT